MVKTMKNKKQLFKPLITGEIEIEVKDKEGRTIKKIKQPSHSFNVDFYLAIRSLFTADPTQQPKVTIRDINVNQYDILLSTLTNAGDWAFLAPASNDNYGILVGSGSTSWEYWQYMLISKIPHGSGAGQLVYNACTDVSTSDSGTPAKIGMQRIFDNNSGADITVREIGYFGIAKVTGPAFTYHMIARDVITPVTVPNGGRLTVTYRMLLNPT
jgi:hypothetical protein